MKPSDPTKRLAFCEEVLDVMERDEGLSIRFILRDEVILHLCGKVNRHNIWIWVSKKPVNCGGNGM
jgi:hypothetical protein